MDALKNLQMKVQMVKITPPQIPTTKKTPANFQFHKLKYKYYTNFIAGAFQILNPLVLKI